MLHARGPNAKPPRGRDGPKFAERLQDEARFLKSWLENPKVAGAIMPSSPALARAMAREVNPSRPGPVVELGPGTGPVTEALLRRGVAQDRLVLVEFDPEFCRLLARRFPRARIVRGDAYALAQTLKGVLHQPAAAVVSSLPLLTRPEPDRVALLADAFRLLSPGAPFVQFTYGLVSPVPREAGGFTADVSPPIWLNLPPARVWVYRRDGSADAPSVHRLEPDLIDRLKRQTEKVRDELLERTEKVRSDWRDLRGKALDEPAIRPTIDLLRRLGEHLEGPDAPREADRDLRARADAEARRTRRR
ncbi:class I SAM-dependent methyltransferase [Alsobacter ponti]|uniref:class I SAM-dependent methyltransferase n=1 Tax=Alsobacter ponti TaxID=2962936 RepID=UPI0027D960AA|nr:methyltransferase domain-containing protein [Alsobacter ponti]